MQTKVGLTTILRKYKVSLNEKTKVPIKLAADSFSPKVDGGLWMDFEQV